MKKSDYILSAIVIVFLATVVVGAVNMGLERAKRRNSVQADTESPIESRVKLLEGRVGDSERKIEEHLSLIVTSFMQIYETIQTMNKVDNEIIKHLFPPPTTGMVIRTDFLEKHLKGVAK